MKTPRNAALHPVENHYRNLIPLHVASKENPSLDRALLAAARTDAERFLAYGSNRAAARCAARIIRLSEEGDARYDDQAAEAIEWLNYYGIGGNGKALSMVA